MPTHIFAAKIVPLFYRGLEVLQYSFSNCDTKAFKRFNHERFRSLNKHTLKLNILKFIFEKQISYFQQKTSCKNILESNFPQLRVRLWIGRHPLHSLDGVVDAGLQLAQVGLKYVENLKSRICSRIFVSCHLHYHSATCPRLFEIGGVSK